MKPLYIVWKDTYNLNVPIVDEQHRAIVATINSLYFFIQEGWGLSALRPTLSIIKMYSAFHAKTEEGMLQKAKYPRLNHRSESQKEFERQVDKTTDEAMLNRDPNILLKFLRTWWIQHLSDEHKEYVGFFEEDKEE